MFRFRRRARLGQFTLAQNQALNQSLHLLANGKPGEAALILSRIAKEMEDSHHPRRAANLFAQAAHAFADAQDANAALAQSQAALRLFLQYQMAQRALQFYSNITRKLRNKGMASAAQTLTNEFESQMDSVPARQTVSAPNHPEGLPVACPQCGGPIRPDEADWVDEHTIQCVYCGAMIQSS